jgi:hypothetical protein
MAEIYLKSSENTLILEPREYMLRPFDFGDWNEIRMGMYFSGVLSSDNNGNVTNETVVYASFLDRIMFGIKDSSTALPGDTGSLFLGVGSAASGSATVGTGAFGGNLDAQGLGIYDATSVAGSGSGGGNTMAFPNDVSGSSSYCGFFGIKMHWTDKGLSSQVAQIDFATAATVSGSTYTVAALRTQLLNATYAANSVTWNDGASARAVPTCWYLRLPFYNNRIRLSVIDMIKIS